MSEENTGTGSGSAETAGAGTAVTGEGAGNSTSTEEKAPELGAETRLAMKRLERENKALMEKLNAKTEAEKTEHQRAIDEAAKRAAAETEAKYAKQATSFAVQRELLSRGVSKDAVEDLAELVVSKNPDIDTDDIPDVVESKLKALGLTPKPAASAPGTGGAPSGPQVKDNPWSKGGWDVQKQMLYVNQHGRDAAEKMAASVGSSITATSPPG